MERHDLIEQDGKLYRVGSLDHIFSYGDLGYNPLSGVVMVVDEEDDMILVQEEWYHVTPVASTPMPLHRKDLADINYMIDRFNIMYGDQDDEVWDKELHRLNNLKERINERQKLKYWK